MITTVTLNASIDKAYHMTQKIENGTVMRVAETNNSAGGKKRTECGKGGQALRF